MDQQELITQVIVGEMNERMEVYEQSWTMEGGRKVEWRLKYIILDPLHTDSTNQAATPLNKNIHN